MFTQSHESSGLVRFMCGLLALIILDFGMMGVALKHYPAFWLQHGALAYVLPSVLALLLYAVAILWLTKRRGEWWKTTERIALPIGLVAAVLDVTGFAFEEGLFRNPTGPALQISVMLATFLLWGFAGWRAARRLRSIRAGVVASLFSAGVCATLAVTAGFAIEMFVAPPASAYVALWGEYRRSGWTDARAFGLANTLDSAFSHLTLSLIVAVVFGGIASVAAQMTSRMDDRSNATARNANLG